LTICPGHDQGATTALAARISKWGEYVLGSKVNFLAVVIFRCFRKTEVSLNECFFLLCAVIGGTLDHGVVDPSRHQRIPASSWEHVLCHEFLCCFGPPNSSLHCFIFFLSCTKHESLRRLFIIGGSITICGGCCLIIVTAASRVGNLLSHRRFHSIGINTDISLDNTNDFGQCWIPPSSSSLFSISNERKEDPIRTHTFESH
jgi:hypothetical protein